MSASITLLSQQQAHALTVPWAADALRDIDERLTGRGFPCIFSRNAYKKGLVQFCFVDAVDERGLRDLADVLLEFVAESRDWNERVDSARPLVVVFAEHVTGRQTVDGYHAFGWSVLQRLHKVDPNPWPAGIPDDPHDPDWSMCFADMPLFVNMSTPAHARRHSRNLGRCFAFVINPRERFDVLAGDTPRGRKARETIRRRVDAYDAVPHSADLATYGNGAVEWQQYALLDDDTSSHGTCPFDPARPRSAALATLATTKEMHS
jgi:FPC/CPF motif-containing protein YcgG